MCTNEKILNKIKNLLDLSNNNPNENEAIAAALKAQELMAKYDVEIAELEDTPADKEIVEEIFYEGNGHQVKNWKYGLARVVSSNFRCKYYILNKKHIVFYGYKEDAKIAKDVFTYLYKTGNKLANRYYNQIRKSGESTKGILNTYLVGFRDGVAAALEKQCTALMIVTPKDVEDGYQKMTASFGKMHTKVSTLGHDNKAYSEGKIDGKSMAEARALEA